MARSAGLCSLSERLRVCFSGGIGEGWAGDGRKMPSSTFCTSVAVSASISRGGPPTELHARGGPRWGTATQTFAHTHQGGAPPALPPARAPPKGLVPDTHQR